jgi:hypothetical protein
MNINRADTHNVEVSSDRNVHIERVGIPKEVSTVQLSNQELFVETADYVNVIKKRFHKYLSCRLSFRFERETSSESSCTFKR